MVKDWPPLEVRYVFMATEHHRALVNGFSGYDPLPHREIVPWTATDPIDPQLLPTLERIGTSIVVIHSDEIAMKPDDPFRKWLRDGIRAGRITFVKRFDADIQGDWGFALTRNEPLAASWRDAEAPDAAGRTPLQNLAVFLEAKDFTASSRPRGFIEVFEQNAGGAALRISGWAGSLAGIRSVELLFDHGDVVHRAELGPRPDIERRLPWYAGGKAVAFHRTFERWPEGARLETDLIVKITDNDGSVRFLEQRWIDRQRPDL
jgi:hypothetical protein